MTPDRGTFALMVMRNFTVAEREVLKTMAGMAGPPGIGLEDTYAWFQLRRQQ